MKKILFLLTLLPSIAFSQEPITPDWTTESNSAGALLGGFVGSCGDLNQDGYIDIYSLSFNNYTNIYYGKASGYSLSPDLVINHAGAIINGYSSGDLNKDGFSDLIVADANHNKVYIFSGSISGIGQNPNLVLTSPENAGSFGYSVDATGDINGDGYNDLLVGQPYLNRGFGLYGKALIYYGSTAGIASTADKELVTIAGTLGYGSYTKFAGDVNNDGYDDVLISAQKVPGITLLSTEFTDLFLGSSSGLQGSVTKSILGTVRSVGKAGDLNNDQFDDIIFSFYDSYTATYSIVAYIGNTDGLSNSIYFQKIGGFVGFVMGIGDFNQDNYDDLIINDITYSYGSYSYQGKIDILLGSASGLNQLPRFTYSPNKSNANIGSICYAGDLNKDGFDDLLLGWQKYSSPESNEGRLLIMNGRTSLAPEFTVDKTSSCISNNSFTFTNSSSLDATSYLWDFGDGATSNEMNPYHTYTTSGTFNVKLTIYDNYDHLNAKTKSSYITIKPSAPGGSYTLGGSNADFNTISNLNDFFACGINGNVSVSIRDGIYDEQLVLKNTNTSGNNTFTIFSESKNSQKVTIGTAWLENSKNIFISDITLYHPLNPIGYAPAQTANILNCNNITIDRCKIYRTYNSGQLITGSLSNYITIKNSYLGFDPDTSKTSGGTSSITLSKCNSTVIDSNYFLLIQGYGVLSKNSNDISIKGNYIRGKNYPNDFVSYWGIELNNNNGIFISGNTINRIAKALIISDSKGLENNRNLIINNSIGGQIGSTQSYQSEHAVNLNNCSNLKLFHNSINFDSDYFYTYDTPSHCIQILNSDSITIKNNLFRSIWGKSACLYIDFPNCKYISSDYNSFTGYVMVQENSSSFPVGKMKLSDWRRLYHIDLNSIADSIGMVSRYDLIPVFNSNSLNESAFYLSEAGNDIHGNPRGPATSDIGAFNVSGGSSYYALNKNIGIVSIVNDSLFNKPESIKVKFTNSKSIIANTVNISYQVDDESVVTETWNGSLKNADTILYTFTTPYIPERGRIYNLKCWVSLPNGEFDNQTYNDTLSKEIYKKMKGVYSIYGTAPYFSDLKIANYNLQKCSADSLVVFDIRPGDYPLDNDYTFEKGPVIIRSSTGNRNDVKLHLNKVIRDDIQFKHLTIYPDYGISGTGIDVYTCKNITFDSCDFAKGQTMNAIGLGPSSKNIKITNCNFKNFNSPIHINNAPYYYGNLPMGNYEVSNCYIDSCKYGLIISCGFGYGNAGLLYKNNVIKKPESAFYFPENLINIYNLNFVQNTVDSASQSILTMHSSSFLNSSFSKNKFSSFGTAINCFNCNNISFYNNMISCLNLYKVGFYISDSKGVKIYNNSVIGAIYCSGVYLNDNTSMNVAYNNIFYSDSTQLLEVDSHYSGRNNNFFRADSGPIGRLTIYDTLNTLEMIYKKLGIEKYSISKDPKFKSKVDLHSESGYMKERGMYLTEISDDIDGDTRSLTAPDLGADEIKFIPAISSTPAITSIIPANSRINVPIDTFFTIIFDRSISFYDDAIKIYNANDNSLAGEIKLNSTQISLIDSNKVRFKLSFLKENSDYYILFPKNTFINTGMGNDQISDPTYYYFKTSPAPVINKKPSITITSPINNASLSAPIDVIITVLANDEDGTISKVEFYNGTSLIGTSTSSPFNFAWTNVNAGSYTLTAKAFDNMNENAISNKISITLSNNKSPNISIISPVNNATFTSSTTITINCSANDIDGTISKVELYNGSTLISTITESPFNFVWTNISAGTYVLTAKAYDNNNNSAVSNPVSITLSNITSIETENIMDKLKIYPNPVHDIIVIEKKDIDILSIEVIDAVGSTKEFFLSEENKMMINTLSWSEGIYMLKLKTSSGFYTQRIVKVR